MYDEKEVPKRLETSFEAETSCTCAIAVRRRRGVLPFPLL